MQSGLHFKPGESNVSAWTPSLHSLALVYSFLSLIHLQADTPGLVQSGLGDRMEGTRKVPFKSYFESTWKGVTS